MKPDTRQHYEILELGKDVIIARMRCDTCDGRLEEIEIPDSYYKPCAYDGCGEHTFTELGCPVCDKWIIFNFFSMQKDDGFYVVVGVVVIYTVITIKLLIGAPTGDEPDELT